LVDTLNWRKNLILLAGFNLILVTGVSVVAYFFRPTHYFLLNKVHSKHS